MRRALLLCLLPLAACAGGPATVPDDFSAAQRARLAAALRIGEAALADSTFGAVVEEMAAAGEVVWRRRHRQRLPDSVAHPTRWLLRHVRAHGLFPADSLRVWPESRRQTRTTAVTTACHGATALNVFKLDRDMFAIANTLVHERTHTLCQKHGPRSGRAPNRCDAAYVFGDLAEMLAAYRATGAATQPRQTLCPALHARLAARGIAPPAEGPPPLATHAASGEEPQ